jgi:hypothetical protein
MEQAIKALELGKKGGNPENVTVAERLIPQFREALELGIAVEIDVEHGIAMTSGGLGQRTWTKDFRWLPADGPDHLAVDAAAFTDYTAPISDKAASPDDLLLIGHAGSWRPGSPAHDTDTKLVDIATGEMQRIPFPFGISGDRCPTKGQRACFKLTWPPGECVDSVRICLPAFRCSQLYLPMATRLRSSIATEASRTLYKHKSVSLT